MKKKTLLTAALASLFTLSICSCSVLANTPAGEADTVKPEKTCGPDCQCKKEHPGKECTPDCKCGCQRPDRPERMTPEERRAEFEKRMNLTEEQKAKLEAIKADEHKKLEPIRNKMKKKHDEMRELMKSEAEIRKSSMEKFEAVLTPEQKAELEKMKAEIHEQMKNNFDRPEGPKGPRGHRGPGGPGMEPDVPPMMGPAPMGPAPMEPAPEK